MPGCLDAWMPGCRDAVVPWWLRRVKRQSSTLVFSLSDFQMTLVYKVDVVESILATLPQGPHSGEGLATIAST